MSDKHTSFMTKKSTSIVGGLFVVAIVIGCIVFHGVKRSAETE
jgi:hypothetical protein